MNSRVVITGLGWVTPLGLDIESVWKRMLSGESAASEIRLFDASTFPTTFACQVAEDYDHRQYVGDSPHHEGVGRHTSFALGAAVQAWRHSGLDQLSEQGKLDHERLGIYLGAGEGSMDVDPYIAANLAGWDQQQRKVDAVTWVQHAKAGLDMRREMEQEPNMPLCHLAMQFEARGPALNCLTACAASTQAIGEATEILRRGDADVMLAGGAHSMIHPFGLTGFNRLTALSNRNDDPKTASRPFCRDRDGFVLGEGAGIIVLETVEHAEQRGATPLAYITGYGSSSDAFRITDMHPEGRGPATAMSRALKDANLEPADVDYISAHGTSTEENDSTETKAIKLIFGQQNPTVPVSSIKSMVGHLIAAAGVTEAIACVLALRDQILPPTINYVSPDPALDLDYVPNEAREAKVQRVLSNSFGFGGQNDSIVLEHPSVAE